ncbi:hypothetical protein KEM55_002066 [Ascosphaera atra]|nr:hypothetical protein KEM55_002066 [Ascosphaera atra]
MPPTANHALTEVKKRTSRKTRWLTGVSTASFVAAFTIASPRRKHPYLLWTSAVAVVGGWCIQSWTDRGLLYEAFKHPVGIVRESIVKVCHYIGYEVTAWQDRTPSASPQPRSSEDASTVRGYTPSQSIATAPDEEPLAGSSMYIIDNEEGAMTPSETMRSSQHGAVPQIDPLLNGESVAKRLEREQAIFKVMSRAMLAGFAMAVVGIWGEGA